MDSHRVQKLGLMTATALISVNIWTGAPLLALWVGSQVQGSSGLSMGAVFLVVVVLALLVFALAMALTWLNERYDRLIGVEERPGRTRYPWLQSMRGERADEVRRQQGVTGPEKAMIVIVVIAALAFEVWFFFFAGSSI